MSDIISPLKNLYALRCVRGSEAAVRADLSRLAGDIKPTRLSSLLITRFADDARSQAAMQHLRERVRDGSVQWVTPVLHDDDSDTNLILTDEIVVRFDRPPTDGQLRDVQQRHGLVDPAVDEYDDNQFVMRVPRTWGMQTYQIARQLNESNGVDFAEPNYISEFRR